MTIAEGQLLDFTKITFSSGDYVILETVDDFLRFIDDTLFGNVEPETKLIEVMSRDFSTGTVKMTRAEFEALEPFEWP